MREPPPLSQLCNRWGRKKSSWKLSWAFSPPISSAFTAALWLAASLRRAAGNRNVMEELPSSLSLLLYVCGYMTVKPSYIYYQIVKKKYYRAVGWSMEAKKGSVLNEWISGILWNSKNTWISKDKTLVVPYNQAAVSAFTLTHVQLQVLVLEYRTTSINSPGHYSIKSQNSRGLF